MNEALWQDTVNFHGHVCPGIVVGFRASVLALETLNKPLKKLGETHIAICENDVCGVDGVQFITGCTLGFQRTITPSSQGKRGYGLRRGKAAMD